MTQKLRHSHCSRILYNLKEQRMQDQWGEANESQRGADLLVIQSNEKIPVSVE